MIEQFLNIEKCEFGKHLDSKFQRNIDREYSFGKTVEDFYCISSKNNNITLYYYPNIG